MPATVEFPDMCTLDNLTRAFEKARHRKTRKPYVLAFQAHLADNLAQLQQELATGTYRPRPLQTFIIRDPKTRTISKADFRDRIVHHALCNIIEPVLDKQFISDNYANRKTKGTINAIAQFNRYQRKVSHNHTRPCYILKADVRHYFDTVDHHLLLDILQRTIRDERLLTLIASILNNHKTNKEGKGMPLGNLTSQFFANVYLNELDQYVKHHCKARYYLRYVDDFVILSHRKNELRSLRANIDTFLQKHLALELHPDKTRIITLDSGVPFLGMRIFPRHQLLKRKNMRHFHRRLQTYRREVAQGTRDRESVVAAVQGWLAHAAQSNTYKYRRSILRTINRDFPATLPATARQTSFTKQARRAEQPFTIQNTLLLYNQGKSPARIAELRKIKESAVRAHLATLIGYRQLPLVRVLPKETIQRITPHIHHEQDTLTTINARINDPAITYDDIACVLAHRRASNGSATIKQLIRWYQRTNCERKCYLRPEQISRCNSKFAQLTQASPRLTMSKPSFLEFCNSHTTICILPDHQKRQHITWREHLILKRATRQVQSTDRPRTA